MLKGLFRAGYSAHVWTAGMTIGIASAQFAASSKNSFMTAMNFTAFTGKPFTAAIVRLMLCLLRTRRANGPASPLSFPPSAQALQTADAWNNSGAPSSLAPW